jgi:hypothetical protein
MRKKMKKYFLMFVITTGLVGWVQEGNSQVGTFRAGAAVGLNFAELEGNDVFDYFGLNAGLVADYQFAKRWQLGMELLYSQNGEYILPRYYPDISYGNIWLHHVEIPIHIDFLMNVYKKHRFNDWHVQLGGAYAYIFDLFAESELRDEVTDQVVYDRRSNWMLQFGTTYYFRKNIGWNLRVSVPTQEVLGVTLATRILFYFG